MAFDVRDYSALDKHRGIPMTADRKVLKRLRREWEARDRRRRRADRKRVIWTMSNARLRRELKNRRDTRAWRCRAYGELVRRQA